MTFGYLQPVPPSPALYPGKLNLMQFLQTVITGVSGLPGELVRPKIQESPPKQPGINVNWLAFGVKGSLPDANSYLGVSASGAATTQRHEALELDLSVYGPDALEVCDLIRDGFQIPQNLQALTLSKMGFVEVTSPLRVPDLINERWFNKYEMSAIIRREIQRTYPILTLISAHGTIHTVTGTEPYLLNWSTENIES